MSDHDSTTGKICRACNIHKPFADFSAKKKNKDGLNNICRPCAALQFKAYAEKHREELSEKQTARYRARTPEQKEHYRNLANKSRAKNADTINERRRTRGLTPEQEEGYKRRSREWYLANKGKVLEKMSAYYVENREAVMARIRQYERANPEKVRLLGRVKVHRRRLRLEAKGGNLYTRQDLERLYELQKGCCAACRKKLKGKYHVDHRIPIAKGGDGTVGNIELLCPPCNMRKGAKLPHVFAQENGRLI